VDDKYCHDLYFHTFAGMKSTELHWVLLIGAFMPEAAAAVLDAMHVHFSNPPAAPEKQ
jgi:hypothetical protein